MSTNATATMETRPGHRIRIYWPDAIAVEYLGNCAGRWDLDESVWTITPDDGEPVRIVITREITYTTNPAPTETP